MRRAIKEHSAQLALIALCLVAGVLIFLVALDTTPIADDYGDLPSIGHTSVFHYLNSYWASLTDRYSNAIFMVLLVKLFGSAAIHIATPMLLWVLFCFGVFAAQAIGAAGSGDKIAFGGLSAITIAVSTPSIFDTLGWFNSVAIYLAGIVAFVGIATWIARTATAPARSWRVPASFLFGLFAAGFTELVGITIAVGSLLAFANIRSIAAPGSRRRGLSLACLAAATGAATGVILIFAGPGSQARTHAQHGGFDLSLIATSVRVNLGWANTDLGWRTAFSLACGLALLRVRGRPSDEREVRWIVVWAIFLCVVPLVVVGAAAGYAGNTAPPLRAISIATASIAVGEALIAYVLAAALVFRWEPLTTKVPLATVAAAAIGVFGFWSAATPILKAELLRQRAVDARGSAISRQLQERPHLVSVMPAPLIDFYGNAYDLFFGHRHQLGYVLEGIRQYYRIPRDVVIRVIPTQPRDYCLPHISIPSYGVKSCAQLFSTTRSY